MIALALTGCSVLTQFIPPSDETKYRFIEAGKDVIAIETAGTVLSEEYDTGGGVISPAWYVAEVQGEDTLEILKERLLNHPEVECETVLERGARCRLEEASIGVWLSKDTPGDIIRVTISDANNGRISKDEKEVTP